MSRQVARRRRRERLVGIIVAALGVVVLIVAVIALHNPHTKAAQAGTPAASPTHSTSPVTSASKAPSAAPSTTPAGTATAPAGSGRLPLVVLNNTTVQGLAQQAKAQFVAGGWTVSSVGNLTNDILSTCAYYDPAAPGAQAAALALQRQFPTIKRVEPKFDGLPAGPVVVVLTPDYSPN